MMKKFMLICMCLGLLFAPLRAQAADSMAQPATLPNAAQEAKVQRMVPVSFIVLDQTGEASPAIRREWRQTVKQAYHVPYYSMLTDPKGEIAAQQLIGASNQSTSKLDAALLAQIAEEAKAQVVALMLIHQMEQQMVQGMWHWHDGPDTYIRTYTSADLYVYKTEGDKLLKKVIRDVSTREIGIDEKPERIIKYAMMKLVNKMENRPDI